MARLITLPSEAVCGILLVTQQFVPDGISSEAYITVVTSSALATLGLVNVTNPPGYSYSDFWDNTVLQPLGLPADSTLHYPLMVAADDQSCKVKLPGIMDFMKDSQPLFFPYGEKVAAFIQMASQCRVWSHIAYRARSLRCVFSFHNQAWAVVSKPWTLPLRRSHSVRNDVHRTIIMLAVHLCLLSRGSGTSSKCRWRS
jgi:hypothetical protein